MKFTLAILIGLFFHGVLLCQDSTTVKLLVKGVSDQYFISVDGKMLRNTNAFTVSRGTHNIQVWSPRYDLYTGKIETGSLEKTSKLVELRPNTEFVAYIAEREEYKKMLFLRKTAPFIIGSASIVALPFLHFARMSKHEELIQSEFYNQFGQVSSEATKNIRTQYQVRNTLFFAALGTAIGGTAAYFLLRKKVKAMKAPVFRQQNPFTLEYFELSFRENMRTPIAGLTLSF